MPCLTGCVLGTVSAAVLTWPFGGGPDDFSDVLRCCATACTAWACCLACTRVVSSTFTMFTFLVCATAFAGATMARLLFTFRVLFTVVLLTFVLFTLTLLMFVTFCWTMFC